MQASKRRPGDGLYGRHCGERTVECVNGRITVSTLGHRALHLTAIHCSATLRYSSEDYLFTSGGAPPTGLGLQHRHHSESLLVDDVRGHTRSAAGIWTRIAQAFRCCDVTQWTSAARLPARLSVLRRAWPCRYSDVPSPVRVGCGPTTLKVTCLGRSCS
jgi:hypothetical protein